MQSNSNVRNMTTIDLDKIVLVTTAAILAGLLAGAVSRFSMRFVAILAGFTPEFTIGGTMVILVIGAVAGIIFGLVFFAVQRYFPGTIVQKGLAFGLVLFLLLVLLPFLLADGGELDLVTPLQGILLFGPIPLVYGLTLGLVIQKLGNRWIPLEEEGMENHRMGIGWVGLFGLGVLLLLVSVSTLASNTLPLPQFAGQINTRLGLGSTGVGLHSTLVMGVAFSYIGLLGLLYWRAGNSMMARFTVLALLLFGGAFFNNGTAYAGMMRAFRPALWIPTILQSLGFVTFILFLYLFPDGRFKPWWTKLMAVLWALVAALWFFNPVPGTALDLSLSPDWLLLVLVMGAFISGAIAQIVRYSKADNKKAMKWPLVAIITTVAGFGLMWAAMLVAPELSGRVSPRLAFQAPFAFGPYLMIWLLIPASLLLAVTKRGLWSE